MFVLFLMNVSVSAVHCMICKISSDTVNMNQLLKTQSNAYFKDCRAWLFNHSIIEFLSPDRKLLFSPVQLEHILIDGETPVTVLTRYLPRVESQDSKTAGGVPLGLYLGYLVSYRS